MIFAAGYAIVVGVLMFGQWAFFLAARQVPELKAEPFWPLSVSACFSVTSPLVV